MILESICNLGVKPVCGDCSYAVFRMRNGDWLNAQYQIGENFEEVDNYSAKGMVVKDRDGDLIWIPAGELQCFVEKIDG